MLVRDAGDDYALVAQADHGDVAGQIAAAWGFDDSLPAPVRDGLKLAATRHDDGWGVSDRRPRIGGPGGAPLSFIDAPLEPLLGTYSACVDVVCAESPMAGLFVSMHVSGLRRNRYGLMERGGAARPLDELSTAVREFVVGEERRQDQLRRQLKLDERQRWQAYQLLQVYDVLSLYVGLRDLEAPDLDDVERVLVPGGETLSVAPVGRWAIAIDPHPLAASTVTLTMAQRRVRKRQWPDDAAFRADYDAAVPRSVEIVVTTRAG